MNRADEMRGGVNAPPRNILILGVGNLLLTDDGFGVHVINALRDFPLPPGVTLVEAGIVSHQLIPDFHEADLLIFIDAVQAGDTPGSIFRFRPEDMQFMSNIKASLHDMSLIDVLHMTALTGERPETIIIAVQPKDVKSCSMELNDEVKAAIPKVIDLIFEELKKHGAMA
ncbi:MAG TPA: HyaD/HybD family hydrogenase maturation endopeptidase [Geobacteraceae bacterium]|nr:HyaD/HybD family hydrogenase maturation endopeptidase [Geobacteraceae bacterium]